MHYLVYQITNTLDGKSYIGCHKTENKDDGYMGSGKILKRAIQKHGLEFFTKEILFEAASSEAMFTKEKELVVVGQQSYNLKQGGSGGWDYNNKKRTSEEQRTLSSSGGKVGGLVAGRKHFLLKTGIFDPKYEQKIKRCLRPDAFAGHAHTQESKARIGAANSIRQAGANNSNYGKHWIKDLETGNSKMVSNNTPIPDGWSKGRIQKRSPAMCRLSIRGPHKGVLANTLH